MKELPDDILQIQIAHCSDVPKEAAIGNIDEKGWVKKMESFDANQIPQMVCRWECNFWWPKDLTQKLMSICLLDVGSSSFADVSHSFSISAGDALRLGYSDHESDVNVSSISAGNPWWFLRHSWWCQLFYCDVFSMVSSSQGSWADVPMLMSSLSFWCLLSAGNDAADANCMKPPRFGAMFLDMNPRIPDDFRVRKWWVSPRIVGMTIGKQKQVK